MVSVIGTSIIKTLRYSDHFDFPLTLEEIHLRLISSTPRSLTEVSKTLQLMIKKSQIKKTGIYYYLPGRKSLVARRTARAKLSLDTLARAKSLSSLLSSLSSILAIYLTGSLAMSNSEGDSDIDLMIITKDNRLWTTRFILTIYTELLGLRRRPRTLHSAGKLCLNLYLSPASYLLPPNRRSLYTAYELIQAVPLYDPHNTRAELLSANPWIHDYLPNYPTGPGLVLGSDLKGRAQPRQSNLRGRSDPKGVFRRPGQTFMTWIEHLLYHFQLFYMKSKITREYITPNSAFFHPNDPSPKIQIN